MSTEQTSSESLKTQPVIELCSIGTELLIGQIQDTNAHWLARQIAALGAHIRRISIVDDDVEDIVSAVRSAIMRGAHLVITTGGLGPTSDDVTTEALGRLTGSEVVVHESVLSSFMERRGVSDRSALRPGLLKMLSAPRACRVHANPAGAAPCIESSVGEGVVYSLPGPPREVQALFDLCVRDAIAGRTWGSRATVRVGVDLPESELGPLLHAVMEAHPNTYLKSYVALRADVGDGHCLPVDIIVRAADDPGARDLLEASLESLSCLLRDKGKEVIRLET